MICAWCGKEMEIAGDGGLVKGAFAIERSDGDKFFLCSLDHAMWLMADWESDEWLAVDVTPKGGPPG